MRIRGALRKVKAKVIDVATMLAGEFASIPVVSLALMRRGREEEVAVGYNMIATCLLAGIIMAAAKPLADFITGGKITNPGAIPGEVTTMVGRLFDLVMYLGVVVLVVGLIMAGINLARCPKKAWKKQG